VVTQKSFNISSNKFDEERLADIGENMKPVLFKGQEILVSGKRHPLVFYFSPEYFYQVQLWGIRRDRYDRQPLLLPAVNIVPKLMAGMDRRIINHQHAGAFQGFRKGVNTGDHHRTGEALFKYPGLERAVFVHKTQYIQPLTFSARHLNRFPNGLPGVGDARLQCETRLIKIYPVYLLLLRLFGQRCQLLPGLCEQVGVTFGS
jgi:hypothetical protein